MFVEFAGGEESFDGSGVELVDEFVAAGEHHRLETVVPCGRPHVDGGVDEVGVGGGDGDAALVEVGADGGGDVSVAELCECVLFPRVVLAAVDGEFGDAVGVVGGVGEAASGSDLGELAMVTGEQDVAARVEVVFDDVGEGADVGHAGFVDDQQRARRGSVESTAPVVECPVHRRRCDPGGIGEFERRPGRGGDTGHPDAGIAVGGGDGVERVGLARAGRADQHADIRGGVAEGADSGHLIVAKRAFCDRPVDGVDGKGSAAGGGERGDEALFDLGEFPAGVLLRSRVGGDGDGVR